jgi:hypothetical protein
MDRGLAADPPREMDHQPAPEMPITPGPLCVFCSVQNNPLTPNMRISLSPTRAVHREIAQLVGALLQVAKGLDVLIGGLRACWEFFFFSMELGSVTLKTNNQHTGLSIQYSVIFQPR